MYKILIDSCGELPQELKEDGHFSNVALVLEVDGQQIVTMRPLTRLIF